MRLPPSAGPSTSWPTSWPHGSAADTDRPSCRGAAVVVRYGTAPDASQHRSRLLHACHRQWETDPPGTLNLTHRFRWFLREGGADAEGGGADGIGGFEEAWE